MRSVYVRGARDTVYRRAFGGQDLVTAKDVVCAAKAPAALLQVLVAAPDPPDADEGYPPIGWDWSHIARVDLPSGVASIVLDGSSFQAKHGGAWVSQLLSASEDARKVICTIAGLRPEPTAEDAFARVAGYSVCRLDLESAEFEVLAPLSRVFF